VSDAPGNNTEQTTDPNRSVQTMLVRTTRNFGIVTLVSVAVVALSYVALRESRLYGPGVLAMTVLPLVVDGVVKVAGKVPGPDEMKGMLS